MPEHYTKTTVEASFWCSKCSKNTPHHVSDGRRGACKICLQKLEDEHQQRESLDSMRSKQSSFEF